MQFTVLINQARSLEWGLTAQQAMLFAFVYGAAGWASSIERGGQVYFHLNRQKVCDEMPLLTDKPDTVYRLLKQLEQKGLVQLLTEGNKPFVGVTRKGALWNNSESVNQHSSPTPPTKKPVSRVEHLPEEVGNLSDPEPEGSENNPSRVGNLSEQGSENFPRDHITNNQITNIKSTPQKNSARGSPGSGAGDSARGSRLPADWSLSPEWAADASAIDGRLVPRMGAIAASFRDYWVARPGAGGRKADWRATWRNWLRREAERLPVIRLGPGRGVAAPVPGGQGVAAGRSTRDRSLEQDLYDRSWAKPGGCGDA